MRGLAGLDASRYHLVSLLAHLTTVALLGALLWRRGAGAPAMLVATTF